MCFSATASFSASTILAVIGSYCVYNGWNSRLRYVSCIPFIFSIQQAIEGIVWLGFKYGWQQSIITTFLYGFLIIAFIVWPIWVPLSILYAQPSDINKWWLDKISGLGIAVSCILLTRLIVRGATAEMSCSQISYLIPHFNTRPSTELIFVALAYVLATTLPWFFSTAPYSRVLGTSLAISYVITYFFYYHAFISVWCFFASFLSILIALMVSNSLDHPVYKSLLKRAGHFINN